MKRSFVSTVLKPAAFILLLSVVVSSCSVTMRNHRHRAPEPATKVIIR